MIYIKKSVSTLGGKARLCGKAYVVGQGVNDVHTLGGYTYLRLAVDVHCTRPL